jgi:multiple sugar transport system substrate-binding protein
VVRFWALGREGEVVAELLRDFECEHPEVRVDVQQVPWSAAHEKLLTAHVGEATPDLAQIGNTWIPEFAAVGALAPLDSLVAAGGPVRPGAYFPGIWDTNVLVGRLYGVPWYVDTRLLFYRRDLVARAGCTEGLATWAAWRACLARIKAAQGADEFAILLPLNEWNQAAILGMQAGSPLLKEGGRYGAFGDSAFRRAFEFYVDLYRSGLAPVAGLNEIANPYQEFARGRFAMWITGPWSVGEMRRRLPPALRDAWATAPLPGPDAGPGLSMAGGSSLVVFRRSRHRATAWQVIEFLSRPEQQVRLFALTGDLPARVQAWQDSALRGDPQLRAFWLQLQRVAPLPRVPEWELIATRLIDHAEAVVRGGRPVADALAALDRDADRILEKRRWMLARRGAARND